VDQWAHCGLKLCHLYVQWVWFHRRNWRPKAEICICFKALWLLYQYYRVNIQNFSLLHTQRIYVFCMGPWKSSCYFYMQRLSL
jgi:hypothetical protein